MSRDEVCYAGLWSRFLALAADCLIFCLVFFPITRVVKGVWIMTRSDHLWGYGRLVTDPLCIVFFVIILLYFVILEGIAGSTIGKWLLDLRVIRLDGSTPGLGRAALRNLLRVVDALPAFSILGAILILRSSQRARFGDRIAGTRVAHVRPASQSCR